MITSLDRPFAYKKLSLLAVTICSKFIIKQFNRKKYEFSLSYSENWEQFKGVRYLKKHQNIKGLHFS